MDSESAPITYSYIEYGIIIAYLLFLVYLGFRMKQMNENVSDYFRNGAKGTWWLVGTSLFISSVSAFTFTGNAGAMFTGGWSILAIYWAQGTGLLIGAIFLAAWFRQTRAITPLDVLRARFSVQTEQVLAYLKMLTFSFHGALTLYGLALFSSATFGFPLIATIIVLGIVAVLYSVAGGSWAVMATDFVQSLLMVPLTAVVCYFCLREIGGVGSFIQQTSQIEDLHFLSSKTSEFAPIWMLTTAIVAIIGQTNIQAGVKYFSVKDGNSARKAAAMGCVLISLCCLMWFVPPMVARVLFAEEILAANVSNPAETAYAVMAAKFLPTGMMGLMIVAMFSATMSSLDTALNRNAAIVIRNVIPPLRRLGKKPELSDLASLKLSRFVTALMGAIVISMALVYATQEEFGMTKFYYLFASIVALPVMLPFLLGIFIKNTPPWSGLVAMVAGAIPSILSWISKEIYDESWSYPFRAFMILGFSGVAFLATIPFYKKTSEDYKRRNDEFFKMMRTPIDFEKEVGAGTDTLQLRMIGNATLSLAAFLLLLQLLPNPLEGRLAIGSINLFIALVGFGMLVSARKRERAEGKVNPLAVASSESS